MPVFSINLPADVLDRLDAGRGDVPRSAWVRRVIEQALALMPKDQVWGVGAAFMEPVQIPVSPKIKGTVAVGEKLPVVADPDLTIKAAVAQKLDKAKGELAVLLEAVRVMPMTAREAAAELDLPVMKVTAMEKALSQAGLIEYLAPGVMKAKT